MVAGLEVVEVKSKPNGSIDVEDLKPLLDDTIAGIVTKTSVARSVASSLWGNGE